jgi:integrase/recombinase XerD
MSLLRDRMSRDMERAGLAVRTRSQYIAAIERMALFFGRNPETLGPDDIRAWDDELHRQGLSSGCLGVQAAALIFLYRRTLGRPEMVSFLSYSRARRGLPTVLSMDEAYRVLAALRCPRMRIFFFLLLDTGLRISEGAKLTAGDIDRACGVIHVRNGKGGKDRQVKLGDRLYEMLRKHWREVRMSDPRTEPLSRDSLLFSSRTGARVCLASLNLSLKLAAKAAGIGKRVTPHTFRHSFATAQLEAGTSLPVVQAQLGHTDISSTQIYLRISTRLLREAPCPLDSLPPP